MKPKSPSLTADVVIIKEGKIVLIKRGREPYKGMWALPGGFVEIGEKVEDAARIGANCFEGSGSILIVVAGEFTFGNSQVSLALPCQR